MRTKAFEKLITSEDAALRYLRRKRYKKGRVFCHACNGRSVLRLAGDIRYRCRHCGYTFGPLTGSWMATSKVELTTRLWLVKLFELEVTARQAAVQTGVSYPTALRFFTMIRRSILAEEEPELFRREVELDESYFGCRRKGKRGSLVYTDKFRGYDALTFCGYRHLKVVHGTRFSRSQVHIHGLEGLWSYAKGKLFKHHAVSPEKFPLNLYEIQFRYNHRDEDLFELFFY